MCLRTSTFVVKPMLLISTHWLLWRCDPLDLCSDRPSETQKAIFSRAGALHLSLLSSILCTGAKLAIFFGADRRERDWDGVVKHRTLFVKKFQVKAVVSLSAAALVASSNSQSRLPYTTAASPLSWSAARWR